MICPRCKVEMIKGIAIKPTGEAGALSIVPTSNVKAGDVKLIAVMKCPSCGHSDVGASKPLPPPTLLHTKL